MEGNSTRTQYAGADWLCASRGVSLSPLGRAVAEIIGYVWRGIYHLSTRDLDASDFTDAHMVQVRVPAELATFDHAELAELVVLCYSNRLRMEIKPRGRGHLLLRFHEPAFEMPALDLLADKILSAGPCRATREIR